jgi:hypothetical protein
VFLNSPRPHRETLKNAVGYIYAKPPKKMFCCWFFVKAFTTSAFAKRFFFFWGDCLLPSLRNTRKLDKNTKNRGKTGIEILCVFLGKFSTWTFYKNISMAFLNSPYRVPRNALKRTKKKQGETEVGRWVGGSEI